jgi:hypothetical protein
VRALAAGPRGSNLRQRGVCLSVPLQFSNSHMCAVMNPANIKHISLQDNVSRSFGNYANVLEIYLRLTLQPVGAIDSQMDSVAKAFRHSSSGSVFFTR